MGDIEKYYDNTEKDTPRSNVRYFVESIKTNNKNAIELGCGAGNDTVYLIKSGWNVLAIDKEDVEKRIIKRLNVEELKRFTFQKQCFENLELKECNLIVANYCLSFCSSNKFQELWNKVNKSILKGGYFVGNFFGVNDSWNMIKRDMTFFNKEQVISLFKNFEIISFNEFENDGLTGLGKMKHWHVFDVIAKRK